MHPTLSKSGYALLLSLSILLLCSSVWAVQLSWQAPTTRTDGTSATAAGFYLYYRQAGQPTSKRIDVGFETNYTLKDELTVGQTYYFTVTAYDASGRESAPSNEASITIANPPAGTAPVATNDTTSTPEDTPVTVAVLANDIAAIGQLLSVVACNPPGQGQVTRTGTTTCTYTPPANFAGTTTFTYTIQVLGGVLTATGTVSVTVTAVNDRPVAQADSATTTAGTAVTIAVLTNDSDVDNNPLTVSTTTNASGGTVTRNGNAVGNTVTYTPNAGFTGTGSFNYTVSDGHGGTATGTVTVTVTAATGGNVGLNAGLMAAYSFDAGSGPTVTDSSGKANHGTISGATWTTPGRFGKALTFDGVNDVVTVPDAAPLDLGRQGSLTAWVKLTTRGRWHGVLAKGSANNNAAHNYALEITNTNIIRLILGNGTSSLALDASITPVAGQFYHLVGTWDGTTVRLYINGTLNRSTAQTLTPVGNTAPLVIGRYGGNVDWLAGSVDEVRLYNRALTASEVQATMTTPVSDSQAPTVALTAPKSGATVAGSSVTVSATASDNVGVVGVQFLLDGSPLGAEQTGSFSLSWNTTVVPNGAHTLSARARDAAGNTAMATSVPITIANTPLLGLVAAYSFDAGSGPTVTDSSGKANHGTISGATWTTPGRFGKALTFDGVNDVVTVPDAAPLDLGRQGSLTAWVKLTTRGRWHGVLAKGSANNNAAHNYALEITNTNIIRLILGNGTSSLALDASVTPVAGQFYHLVGTWDGTTVRLYINGTLNRSTAQTLTPVGNTAPLVIGRYGGNVDWLAGSVDEVRLYNRALTASEVQATMTTPVGPLPAASQSQAVVAGASNAAGNQTAVARGSVTKKNPLAPPMARFRTTPSAGIATTGAVPGTPPNSTARPFEFGEIQGDSTWRTVTFREPFSDPIVVARPSSSDNSIPALVQIRDVTSTGFAIRIQEWDNLDGVYRPGTVGYLVAERGRHTLGGNVHIEAGSKETSQINSFVTVPFHQAFAVAPVVLTAVVSPNETAAVTTRVHNVTTNYFQVRMQEHQKNPQGHAQETVTYIAWPPSAGTLAGDLVFEVQKTSDATTQQWKTLRFIESFTAIPVFLADLQTTHASDPASLRWENKDFFGVDVQVAEEQSADSAMEQTDVVGYLALAFHDFTADTDGDGLTNVDEVLRYGTDPAAADTDQDRLNDGEEVQFWGMLWNADPDGDGLINLLDLDSDNDGILDGIEQ